MTTEMSFGLFCSSQHFGDMLQMYYHHVFIFAFFDTSSCH